MKFNEYINPTKVSMKCDRILRNCSIGVFGFNDCHNENIYGQVECQAVLWV